MNRLILDTDIASYLFRDFEFQNRRFDLFERWDSCMSFMSVAELRAGARMASWGARKTAILADFIRTFEIIHSDD